MRYELNAKELYCLAHLGGKRQMFGIPDGFAGMEPQEIMIAIREISNHFLQQGIVQMDMDGRKFLCEEYADLIRYVSECEKCLTVNWYRRGKKDSAYIWWMMDGKLLGAEVLGNSYILSAVEPQEVCHYCEEITLGWNASGTGKQTVLPRIVLKKAARLGKSGDMDGAIRVLRQNGAAEPIAQTIAEGLALDSEFVSMRYMDNRNEEFRKQETAFLYGNGILLEMNQTVVELRTSVVFTPISDEQYRQTMKATFDGFLND